jgi:hypothetical protein
MAKGPILLGMEEKARIEKSPLIQGAVTGLKGAALGAPFGAAIGLMSGKNPFFTGFLGASILGAAMGAGAAALQDLHNKETESGLRVNLENLKGREPTFFSPPTRVAPLTPRPAGRGFPLYVY